MHKPPQTANRRVPHRCIALALFLAGTALGAAGQAAAQSPSEAEPAVPGAAAAPDPFAAPFSMAPAEEESGPGRVGDDIEGRINTAEPAVDGTGGANPDDGEATGVRIGSFLLRPSLHQSVNTQKTTSGPVTEKRRYLETGIRGALTSDWSRHALTINGEGALQKNLTGDIATDPRARLDADLRLDLPDATVAHISGGYEFGREDSNDPNAISGATAQSGVHSVTGGLSLERSLGRLRGLVGLDAERTVYSAAKLSDGSRLDLSDRDRNAATLRGRIGYEISPALVPFLQASIGKTEYDQEQDFEGYRRSSTSYSLRGGVEVDLGEKLRGELGIGYETVRYDDSRLTSIGTLTLDGNATWSPQRGTDVSAGLETTVEDSTAPGESGSVAYRFNGSIAHELRAGLVARLSGATTWRKYPSGSQISDTTTYEVGAGLTYAINRYLEIEGGVDYEWTSRKASENSDDLTARLGLTLKR